MKITHEEVQKDRDFIRQKIIEHNKSNLPEQQESAYGNTSFIARNEAGEIIGGITGTYFWEHMHLDFLWVDPAHQRNGIAGELMAKLERYARDLKCRLMTVDTFSFQAPDFYRKQGFCEFGKLEDHPADHSHYHFVKWLTE